MASTVKHIRSAVAGRAPTTSQLELGELGINTTDGKLFLKRASVEPNLLSKLARVGDHLGQSCNLK